MARASGFSSVHVTQDSCVLSLRLGFWLLAVDLGTQVAAFYDFSP